ncbi:MAG: hypothetical protein DIZ80_09250 [endosymbiont of Galathealinum brachiosum]|uniref:Uncharacterized protein n=1 Tax=endosymbiont of Galathealinum brachiosum TaxID=2200906 RepID=A0A370DDT6_9GAMM|nr:MAG: hypothetical protein DIZ80_09250 [endosymbiont of Galathealinum brachiosum]
MQHINHWPDITKLDLPNTVSQALYQQLSEPFDTESSAREFWNETSTTLIILDPSDFIQTIKRETAWKQIEFTLTYPEYITPLKLNYQLMLAITNDSGSGIYLVIPPELSHLISDYKNSL